MEFYQHLTASVFFAAPLVVVIEPAVTGFSLFLFAWGVACGTLIDLDHFLAARYNTGDWRHVRHALSNLSALTMNNSELEERTTLMSKKQWVFSHLTISLSVPILLLYVSPYLAIYSLIFFIIHLVMDFIPEIKNMVWG